MTFVVNTLNYRLYLNQSGSDRVVTVSASGQAHIEVKAPNLAQISQQQTGSLGGVVSLRIPAQHIVEIDGPPNGVQIDLQVIA